MPEPDWRPIETAPRDGTQVILRTDDEDEGVGHWCDDYGGWWWWGQHSDYTCNPIQWKPLPTPPKEQNDG